MTDYVVPALCGLSAIADIIFGLLIGRDNKSETGRVVI